MQLVIFLRNSSLKGFLGILLITVFTLKSCDLFIDYYSAFNKSVAVEDPAGDESRDISEDCFEKSAKKLYSCFENPINFRSITWVTPLSIHWCVYSFSIFKEPLRVVLTPPPNHFLA
ncbi:MAG: hypothetical protein EOP46_04035 [Sphingobacteriaceae bacterium]|nr:MAG: hypothetical protein EOP46_04035 [Sphingobacteriaceae bacterium]